MYREGVCHDCRLSLLLIVRLGCNGLGVRLGNTSVVGFGGGFLCGFGIGFGGGFGGGFNDGFGNGLVGIV